MVHVYKQGWGGGIPYAWNLHRTPCLPWWYSEQTKVTHKSPWHIFTEPITCHGVCLPRSIWTLGISPSWQTSWSVSCKETWTSYLGVGAAHDLWRTEMWFSVFLISSVGTPWNSEMPLTRRAQQLRLTNPDGILLSDLHQALQRMLSCYGNCTSPDYIVLYTLRSIVLGHKTTTVEWPWTAGNTSLLW